MCKTKIFKQLSVYGEEIVCWLAVYKKKKIYLNFGICQRCSFGVIETSRVESSWAELCCVVVPVYFSYVFFNTQQFYFHFIFFSFFFVCLLCIQCKSHAAFTLFSVLLFIIVLNECIFYIQFTFICFQFTLKKKTKKEKKYTKN